MLNSAQESFARYIAEGLDQTEACRKAYPNNNYSEKTLWERASRLANSPNIKARIAELREKLTNESIMTAKERLEWLTKVIRDEEVPMKQRLSASDQMNKMQGEYVTKVEGNIGVTKLEDLI